VPRQFELSQLSVNVTLVPSLNELTVTRARSAATWVPRFTARDVNDYDFEQCFESNTAKDEVGTP